MWLKRALGLVVFRVLSPSFLWLHGEHPCSRASLQVLVVKYPQIVNVIV